MATDNYKENRVGDAAGAATIESGSTEITERATKKEWLNLLGNVSELYRIWKRGVFDPEEVNWLKSIGLNLEEVASFKKDGFTPDRIESIKNEAYNILSPDDRVKKKYEGSAFARERRLMLREAVLSREIDEDDTNWQLLKILFDEPGKDYVELALGARDIIEVAGLKRDPRSQVSFSELLFGVHREFNKKIDALMENTKNDQEAASKLAAAQSEDKMIEGYLWRIPDAKLWNELFKIRFSAEAGPEREFEKKMVQPKTAAEVDSELLRLKKEMEKIWSGIGGAEKATSPISLDAAMPQIKNILLRQADVHDLELDARYASEDPEQQIQELGKRFDSETINADELEEGYMRIAKTMSLEKRREMGRLAMREARLYEDAVSLLDPEDKDRKTLQTKLRLCEIMANVYSK